MYLKKKLYLSLCLILISIIVYANKILDNKYELNLPEKINNWSLSDKPDIFVGDDLFQHINGGAEIYHEYGFKRVISGVYKNKGLKSINAEIYEMNSLKSAYGIYSFKTSSEGRIIDLNGNEGLLEDYYLNFYTGTYMVTLVGFDSKKDTINGLLSIAKYISKTLPSTVSPQVEISNKIHLIKKDPLKIKYIMGELALFNVYKFAEVDLFDIKEGVECIVGYYESSKVFIFIYKDNLTLNDIYQRSFKYFSKNSPENFTKHMDGFSFIDKNSNKIITIPLDNKLYIYLGKQSASKPAFFNIK